MKSFKKIRSKSDSSFFDKLNKEELAQFIKETKEEVNGLWEEEKTAREQGISESSSTSLKRHKKLSQSITTLAAAEKKMPEAGAEGFITGKMEYGEEPESNSSMVVTKVAFSSKYGVCSDEVVDFSDYKRFWILEDGGKYYHWLKERNNPDDSCEYKPHPIPITFPSTDEISFTVTFKITSKESFTSEPSIRATDKSGNYLFGIAKGELCDEFQVVFYSINTPFEQTVQYIPMFEILFEYSQNDGDTWHSAGSCITTLYVTWRRPLFREFDSSSKEMKTMRLSNKKNAMNCIVESLLWLGCANADGLGNQPLSEDEYTLTLRNEEAIVDAIFKPFTTLKVVRVREGTKYYAKNDVVADKGLGYWRGKSGPDDSLADPKYNDLRSLRYLLREGEARCGEWTGLFRHLLLTQGIFAFTYRDVISICTDYAREKFTYLRNTCTYVSNSWDYTLKSTRFSVGGAEFVINDDSTDFIIEGKSVAQGNDDAHPYFMDHVWIYFNRERFYDPSYGLSFSKQDSSLINYCSEVIPSVVFETDDSYDVEYDDTHTFLYSSVKTSF